MEITSDEQARELLEKIEKYLRDKYPHVIPSNCTVYLSAGDSEIFFESTDGYSETSGRF